MSDTIQPEDTQQASASPAVGRRRRRRWPWLLALPVLLVLLLGAGVFGLLASDSGSGWLLRQLSNAAPSRGLRFEFAASRGALLDRIELDDVVLHVADTAIEVAGLRLQWRPRALWQRRLHVDDIALAGVRILPPPPAEPGEPTPLQLPDLQSPLAIRLDRLSIDDVVVTQPDGTIRVAHAGLAATLDESGVRLSDLALHVEGATLSGALAMAVRAPHALKGDLDIALPESLTGADVGDVALHATLGGEALNPAIGLRVSAPATLHVNGHVDLTRSVPALDLAADWPELRWPLQGDAQVSTEDGSLQLQGTADDYRLTLRAPVQLPERPVLDVSLHGQGDQNGLRLQPLSVGIGDGRLQADGRVDWVGGVAWQLQVAAEHIDPGLFAADWPGSIDGRITLDGRLPADGRLAVNALVETLSGTLRGYPVSATGGLDWRNDGLVADRLDLASGPNRVRINGRAVGHLDLAFDIDAPDLAALYPGLAGRVSGKGTLAGTPQAPAIVASLQGGELGYRDAQGEAARVAVLSLKVDWRGDSGHGELSASDVSSGDTTVNDVSASLDGRIDAHRLTVRGTGPDVSVALAGNGGLDTAGMQWQGVLRQLDATLAGLGAWQLRDPTGLRVGQAQATVDSLCLAQGSTAMCVRGGWAQAGGLDLTGELDDLDLATLARYVPGDAVIDGTLAARFTVKGPPARPTATFALRPDDGLLRVDQGGSGDEPFELAYRNAKLDGRFENDRGSAELRLEIGPNGRAAGRLGLGPARDGQRALSGRVEADFPDLALVAGFVPALQAVAGRLALAVDLGGTAAQPAINGDLTITDAAARVPAAGIELRDVALQVSGDGHAPLRVSGKARSGDGEIRIDGSVDPARVGGAAVDLRVTGSDFQAVRLPEALALVSPDLRLQGSGSYRLAGTLRIPRAEVELKELPQGTVSVSDDEIIVGAETPPQKAPGSGQLQAKVRVELGDAVTFKGFGLVTGLTGVLDASSDPRGNTVDGKIELRDASYKAYGQDLTVERGRLLFAGPPGNPDVDLLAVRQSGDGRVKAYLAMSGPLAKPRPRVYTEPALPEAEAVAYLLTGRGLDEARQGEGADIAGAALSLGLSRSEPLLQDLGDRLGLDDLRIEGGDNGLADSSLLLGKYLNPDLYLGYTQGLFNPEGAVLLRLRLTEHVEVESRSGNEQSVDLFYKIEHD